MPNRRAQRVVKAVLANLGEYRFQIIVTEVAALVHKRRPSSPMSIVWMTNTSIQPVP